MSACLDASSSAAPPPPRAEARAARIAKFTREQVIVDFPSRGVSVAEVTAKIGVGEKRMRALIRDPSPGVVAIQVSRLNEALLVAFSAMSGMNLRAVDRMIRVAREFDRHHGVSAAARHLQEPDPRIAVQGLAAPAEAAAEYGGALVGRAELALRELAGFAFGGFDWAPEQSLGRGGAKPAKALEHALPSDAFPAPGTNEGIRSRPENPSQSLEKIDSAPGFALTPEAAAAADMARGPSVAPARRERGPDAFANDAPLDGRP